MIRAKIYEQRDGKIVGFLLTGHNDTGQRGYGYNVHCAEVSMLSSAAYMAIRMYLGREAASENNEHGGLGLQLKDAPDELTEAVFQTMLIGLREIERSFRNVIKIQTIQLDATSEENLHQTLSKMNPTEPPPLPEVKADEIKFSAELFRGEDGKFSGFSVEERKGKVLKEMEIYLASSWALTKAVFACIKDHLKRDLEIDFGTRRLAIKLLDAPDDITEAVFQTLLIGLVEVQKIAPHIVTVTENFSTRR